MGATSSSSYLVSSAMFLCFGYALPNEKRVLRFSSASNVFNRSPEPITCGFEGNPDLYGLGIRLGFYLQVLSTWIAASFAPKELGALRAVNMTFSLAMFSALIFISKDPSTTYAIECYILVVMIICLHFMLSHGRENWSDTYLRFESINIVLSSIFITALAVYNLWFWWSGYLTFASTPCGTFGFAYWRVYLYGWYLNVVRTNVIILVVWYSLFLFPVQSLWYCDLLSHHRHPQYYRKLAKALSEELSTVETLRAFKKYCHAGTQTKPEIVTTDPAITVSKDDTKNEIEHITDIGKCNDGKHVCTLRLNEHNPDNSTVKVEMKAKPSVTMSGVQLSPSRKIEITNHNKSLIPSMSHLANADAIFDTVLQDPIAPLAYCKIPWTGASFAYFPLRNFRVLFVLLNSEDFHFALTKRQYTLPLLYYGFLVQRKPIQYFLAMSKQILETVRLQEDAISADAIRAILIFRICTTLSHNPNLYYWRQLAVQVWSTATIVAMIELTLHWNNVTNAYALNSVGQLIPFLIGVGAFVKVLWECSRSWRAQEEVEDRLIVEVEKCADIYNKGKERRTAN